MTQHGTLYNRLRLGFDLTAVADAPSLLCYGLGLIHEFSYSEWTAPEVRRRHRLRFRLSQTRLSVIRERRNATSWQSTDDLDLTYFVQKRHLQTRC
jgi:hypothetical protein